MKSTLIGLQLILVAAASAQTYNVLDAFSVASPTNGPWNLGYREGTGGTAFTLMSWFTNLPSYVEADHQRWTVEEREPLYFGFYRNPHPFLIHQGDIANSIIPANDWMIHPDDPNVNPVARFTAPTSADFKVNYSVARLSLMAGTTIVFVSKNGALLDSATAIVNNYMYESRPEFSIHLNAGDFIDFEVNNNGPFVGDSTGLRASLSSVPEPITAITIGIGVVCMLRRRRKA